MTNKVVSMFSDIVPDAIGLANADVINLLEELLARAKSGELQGLAAAYANADGTVENSVEGAGDRFAMSHAVSALWFRYQMNMFEDSKRVD